MPEPPIALAGECFYTSSSSLQYIFLKII